MNFEELFTKERIFLLTKVMLNKRIFYIFVFYKSKAFLLIAFVHLKYILIYYSKPRLMSFRSKHLFSIRQNDLSVLTHKKSKLYFSFVIGSGLARVKKQFQALKPAKAYTLYQ